MKYRIEYKDTLNWSLYSDYSDQDLISFKDDCLRLISNGYTIKAYQVF